LVKIGIACELIDVVYLICLENLDIPSRFQLKYKTINQGYAVMKTQYTAVLLGALALGLSAGASASEHHTALALEHAASAAAHGQDGHAEQALKHAEEALKHAEAAEKDHADAHVHATTAVKHLKEAIEHAKKGHADVSANHAQEASAHLRQSIEQ
jgi:hypothetical protein